MSDLVTLNRFGVAYSAGPYSVPALTDIDLTIAKGERLAIIGESGSGKSTLALALANLLPPGVQLSGEILWPGLDHAPTPGRDIGVVFQDPTASLNPVLTIGEQIAEGAQRHLGLSWPQAYERARDLLGRVHIPDPTSAVHAYAHQLSGGQRQRVAIAAAIAANPRLLIADEATSALDMVVQAEIVALLNELVRHSRMTLLFITHDIALASTLADRIAVFRNAHLIETGAAATMIRAPQNAYTADLVAAHIGLDTRPMVHEDIAP